MNIGGINTDMPHFGRSSKDFDSVIFLYTSKIADYQDSLTFGGRDSRSDIGGYLLDN